MWSIVGGHLVGDSSRGWSVEVNSPGHCHIKEIVPTTKSLCVSKKIYNVLQMSDLRGSEQAHWSRGLNLWPSRPKTRQLSLSSCQYGSHSTWVLLCITNVPALVCDWKRPYDCQVVQWSSLTSSGQHLKEPLENAQLQDIDLIGWILY